MTRIPKGVDLARLEKLQKLIASKLRLEPINVDNVRYIAGLDVSYSKKYGGIAVAVIYDIKADKIIEWSTAIGEPPFPYIPGFLAFREAPLLYTAIQQLKTRYDVVLVDGHGIAHPRKAGIASHIGAALSKPSIGVAKRKLVGREVEEGRRHYLVYNGEKVAVIVYHNNRRLYISPGCCIDLNSAYNLVLKLLKQNYHLPIPIYYADRISRDIARKLDRGTLTPNDVRKRTVWRIG